METEIYYFSGTGNSFHVARELQRRLPKTVLLPIVSFLGNETITPAAERVGIVFPIHLDFVPSHIRPFFKSIDLSSSEYVFVVVTNGGMANPGISRVWIDKVLREKGGRLNYLFDVVMPMNTPTGLVPTIIKGSKKWANNVSEQNVERIEKEAQKKLEEIARAVEARKSNSGTEPSRLDRAKELFMSRLTESSSKIVGFFSDTTCTSCGTCERVCPSGRVTIVDGRPEWQDGVECYHCYACFNFCPEQAILVKNYLEKNGRYVHPEVSVEDIAGQKQKLIDKV